MQSTSQQEDKQAGLQAVLNDLGAIVPQEPPKAMLEPPDLHVDLADRVSPIAAEVPPLDAALRPAPLNHQTRSVRARRTLARFVLAVCVGVGATIGWQSYGEAAREILATWAPQLVASLPVPAQAGKVAEQPKLTSTETVEQQAPPAQPVAVAAATPAAEAQQQAAPVQAAPAADLAPMLEDMAREIASLRQTIEQLKTGQQQISRELAKAIEQEPRRKTAATPPPTPTPAPRPAAAAIPSRNPSPQQAYTPPPPPREQAYVPPREQVYTPPPPQVYTPPPPQVYTPPPPSTYAAPRPPRPLP